MSFKYGTTLCASVIYETSFSLRISFLFLFAFDPVVSLCFYSWRLCPLSIVASLSLALIYSTLFTAAGKVFLLMFAVLLFTVGDTLAHVGRRKEKSTVLSI